MARPTDTKSYRWTPAELKKLAQLQKAGVPQKQMVPLLGRSLHAIKNQVKAQALANAANRPRGGKVKAGTSDAPNAPDSSTPKFADEAAHLSLVANARPDGFPVAFSRPHFRVRAA